jgi:hypothetical protein
LIVIGTSNGSRRDHQVPRSGKDLLIAERLPKLDIEIPSGIFLTNQAAHYKAIGHMIYYPLFPFELVCSVIRMADLPAGRQAEPCPTQGIESSSGAARPALPQRVKHPLSVAVR